MTNHSLEKHGEQKFNSRVATDHALTIWVSHSCIHNKLVI